MKENLLKICGDIIIGTNKEDIIKEVDILYNLFELELAKDHKEKIIDSLVFFFKWKKVYNIGLAIYIFIQHAKLIKGNLWKLVEEIIIQQEKINNWPELNRYITYFKKYNIDIDLLYKNKEKNNNYLNILVMVIKRPKSINFFFKLNNNLWKCLGEVVMNSSEGTLNAKDILD